MNVAICDDEKITCAEIEKEILAYAKAKHINMEVEIYFSGEELMKNVEKTRKIDVLFLDIELPGVNGIQVGSFIRNSLDNEQMFIVYISSMQEYALQLFQNRPFDFLIKPIEKITIYRTLDQIMKMVGKDTFFFEYQNNRKFYRIPYKNILYFQSTGRSVNIVTKTGTESFYGKLSTIRKMLPDSLFLNIHKSYLVNYNYVEVYSYEWVKMSNGDILSVSKNNRATVRKKIVEKNIRHVGQK